MSTTSSLEDRKKVGELLKDFSTGMLITTCTEDQSLHSRYLLNA